MKHNNKAHVSCHCLNAMETMKISQNRFWKQIHWNINRDDKSAKTKLKCNLCWNKSQNKYPVLLIARGRKKFSEAWRTAGKQKGGKKTPSIQCLCLWKSGEKLKIDTYWKTSQTFRTNPALNSSLCAPGDEGQTFKHWASPENFFYRR